MRIPDELKKCVVFVGTTSKSGQVRDHFAGTAFLVGHEQNGHTFLYLVTADHVVRGVFGKKSWIRVNSIKKKRAEKLSLAGLQWFNHPDNPAVDAAVCVWPFGDDYDTDYIPTDAFVASEQNREYLGIGIGDECFNIGLFVLAHGQHLNTPICRYGTIAMTPGDRIGTKAYGEIEAYLTEARSLPAVSGSPVIVRESLTWPVRIPRANSTDASTYPTSSGAFYLLGLNHGHFEADENRWREIYFGEGDVNIGLSVVVPARLVLEILNQPALADLRAEVVSREPPTDTVPD